jgi:hypothetical protein
MLQQTYEPIVELPARWGSEMEAVRKLRDKLGMPVDIKIRELVVALRLLGFTTTASCAGHRSRITTGPYVMLECKAAFRIFQSATADQSDETRDQLLFKARVETLAEATRLMELIDEFNQERSSRSRELLEIRPVGYYGYRVCFVHADFSYILHRSMYQKILRTRQNDVDRFCKFLTMKLTQTFN